MGVIEEYLDRERIVVGPLIRSRVQPLRGVTSNYISTLVSRWMYEAGIKLGPYDNVSAHALRHTAAYNVIEVDGDMRIAQELLGHQNIATTMHYTRGVKFDRIRAAVEKAAS